MHKTKLLAIFLIANALPATITPSDITNMEWKLTLARRYFGEVWQKYFLFDAIRLYVPPSIVSYRNSVKSACGMLGPNNAFFCERDNTIYYDQFFLAAQMKSVGASLHTDGDYAPIVILAHEWGHAADYWYHRGHTDRSWGILPLETRADCLAGAITLAMKNAKHLDPGDLEEAERTLHGAGDIDVKSLLPQNPNHRETASEVLRDAYRKMNGHGDPATRLRNFRTGYQGGPAACFAQPGAAR